MEKRWHEARDPGSEHAMVKRHNDVSHVGIARLPPEVLVMIFKICSMRNWPSYCGEDSWLCIIYVCRAWREIAFGVGTLWSHIRLHCSTPVNIVSTWLKLSQRAPLTILFDQSSFAWGWSEGAPRLIKVALRHLYRIRELEIYVPDEGPFKAIRKSAYPTLEKLSVGVVKGGEAEFTPLPVLDVTFPNLKLLSLQNLDLDLGSGRFPAGLTALTLWRTFDSRATTTASVTEVLKLLATLPLLEAFRCDGGILSNDTSSNLLPFVHLPRLHTIYLVEDIRPTIDLVTHLSVPRGLQLDITLQITREFRRHAANPTVTAPFIEWVKRVQRPWRTVSFSLESQDWDPDDFSTDPSRCPDSTFALRVDTDFPAALDREATRPSQIAVNLAPKSRHFWHDGFADAFFSGFDYSHVDTMAINMSEIFHSLPRTFRNLSNVKTLWLKHVDYGDGHNSYCATPSRIGPDFMILFDQNFSSGHENSLLFPRLKTLCFDGCADDVGDITGIQHVLSKRADEGSRLEKIVFIRKEIYAREKKRSKTPVPTIPLYMPDDVAVVLLRKSY
ncbi:hypothetical protein BC629DRAFT_1451320 [Irpex lacteus]|nr:hypothetical protein BC629DRAFT_1451320 [Irpex lacteus]